MPALIDHTPREIARARTLYEDTDLGPRAPPSVVTENMDEFRFELARRLDALRRQYEMDEGSGAA